MALVSAGSLLAAGGTRGVGVTARANGKSPYPVAVSAVYLNTCVCDQTSVYRLYSC